MNGMYVATDESLEGTTPSEVLEALEITSYRGRTFLAGHYVRGTGYVSAVFVDRDAKYNFDIGVAEEFQQLGLASELLDLVMMDHAEIGAPIEVFVISSRLRDALLRRGFIISGQSSSSGAFYMTRPS